MSAASDKTISSAAARKTGKYRREFDPECAWIGELSALRMDFQPVLSKRFGLNRFFKRHYFRGSLGDATLARVLFYTRMQSTVVQS
jgi:hypothetical protein